MANDVRTFPVAALELLLTISYRTLQPYQQLAVTPGYPKFAQVYGPQNPAAVVRPRQTCTALLFVY